MAASYVAVPIADADASSERLLDSGSPARATRSAQPATMPAWVHRRLDADAARSTRSSVSSDDSSVSELFDEKSDKLDEETAAPAWTATEGARRAQQRRGRWLLAPLLALGLLATLAAFKAGSSVCSQRALTRQGTSG